MSDQSTESVTLLPEHVRENLSKHNRHESLNCIQCGYVGLMGVAGGDVSCKHSLAQWVIFIAVYAVTVFFISDSYWVKGAIILGFVLWGIKISPVSFECPNCQATGTK
jgi:predicted RNA-binding Zn-ribbon protein involved in translation (DUF1610 family)